MAPTWEKFRDLATRTLLGEAAATGGVYDRDSLISVAHVIKNRADSGAWGDPSQGGAGNVIRAPKQFSMWNQDDPKLKAFGDSKLAIPTSDPNYQRAAAVVDGVFNGQIPDNTGGATNYYAPSGMQGRSAPSWSVGQTPTATIGGQQFYKLPLTAATTGGTATISPSTVGQGTSAPASPAPVAAPSDADAASARAYLSSISAHKDRPGDTSSMNPQFAVPLARALQQARAEGLPLGVMSGYREGEATGSAYDMAGKSSHGYGLASDISGLDGPDGKITKRWAQIAEANGLHNPYGTGDAAEFNHWQLPEKQLETTPELLASLQEAKKSGDMSKVWAAYNDASPQSKVPNQQTYPPVATPAPAANVPASSAQPASATAPGSSGGKFAVPPGSSPGAYPGSDKVSLVQSMTTGTSHNPQITTAANWGNLFGGASTAPPASAPAAPAAAASAPKPLDTSYGPQQPPPTVPPGAPVGQPPGSPASSILPNFGASAPSDAATYPAAAPQAMPGSGLSGMPAVTPGGPSMGFPAMTNPFGQPPPPDQTSSLPGSMFASAQNLIKYLFPSSVG